LTSPRATFASPATARIRLVEGLSADRAPDDVEHLAEEREALLTAVIAARHRSRHHRAESFARREAGGERPGN
jgi:hypothetical protein